MLKKILEYFSLLGITVIILGLLKQIVFYRYYHVPIKYFISLSEVVLLIFEDLIWVVPISVISFAIGVRFGSKRKVTEQSIKSLNTGKNIFQIGSCINLIAGLIILIFVNLNYQQHVQIIALLITFIASLWIISELKKGITDENNDILIGAITLLPILFILSFKSVYDIDSVNAGRYRNTIIKTADTTYISNDSSYFIGRTEKYFFLFNKKDSTTDILPAESVTKITLKER